eukprot:jgi/Botrbrau1/20651/Bobra.113_1s0075.1
MCRAKGDHREGWRPGFNLKGYNDGTQVAVSCNIAAESRELSKADFQCQCQAALASSPALPDPSLPRLSVGWILCVALAAGLGSVLASLALPTMMSMLPSGAGGFHGGYQTGPYSDPQLLRPLRMEEGLPSL